MFFFFKFDDDDGVKTEKINNVDASSPLCEKVLNIIILFLFKNM